MSGIQGESTECFSVNTVDPPLCRLWALSLWTPASFRAVSLCGGGGGRKKVAGICKVAGPLASFLYSARAGVLQGGLGDSGRGRRMGLEEDRQKRRKQQRKEDRERKREPGGREGKEQVQTRWVTREDQESNAAGLGVSMRCSAQSDLLNNPR